MQREQLEKGKIFETIVGSHLYNLNEEDSDEDYAGVIIPGKSVIIGPFFPFEQLQGPGDRVLYNITKAFKLFADANPNMLDLLFAPEDKWLCATKHWEEVHAHKNLFLSTKIKFTYSGYAMAQLKRMSRHRDWLLAPPGAKPKREDYGLTERPLIPTELRKAVLSIPSRYLSEIVVEEAKKEARYHSAIVEWDQYTKWIKNRNPARAETEKLVGYDTKNAMHLVRLMKMAKEIITTGEVNVVRTDDREELLDIKHGKRSYDELVAWAEEQDKELDNIYESGKSPLPKTPDTKKLNELCVEVIESYWSA